MPFRSLSSICRLSGRFFSQFNVNQNIPHIARVRWLIHSITSPHRIVTLVLWKERRENAGQNKNAGAELYLPGRL